MRAHCSGMVGCVGWRCRCAGNHGFRLSTPLSMNSSQTPRAIPACEERRRGTVLRREACRGVACIWLVLTAPSCSCFPFFPFHPLPSAAPLPCRSLLSPFLSALCSSPSPSCSFAQHSYSDTVSLSPSLPSLSLPGSARPWHLPWEASLTSLKCNNLITCQGVMGPEVTAYLLGEPLLQPLGVVADSPQPGAPSAASTRLCHLSSP